MSDVLPSFTMHLPCGKCHRYFPATINGETAAALDRAGVTPQEVMERLERGYLSWELVCPACASAALN